MLKNKKQRILDYESEFYKELSTSKKIDADQETSYFRSVEGYETVNPDSETIDGE